MARAPANAYKNAPARCSSHSRCRQSEDRSARWRFVPEPYRRRVFIAHRSARLTVGGRLLLIERIAAQAASAQGISRPTAYKWWVRWRAAGAGAGSGGGDCGAAPQPGLGTAPDWLGAGAAALYDLRRAAPSGVQPSGRLGPHYAATHPLCARAPRRVAAPGLQTAGAHPAGRGQAAGPAPARH